MPTAADLALAADAPALSRQPAHAADSALAASVSHVSRQGARASDAASASDSARASRQPRHASDASLASDAVRGAAATAADAADTTDAAVPTAPPAHGAETAFSDDQAAGAPPGAAAFDFALSADTSQSALTHVSITTRPVVRVRLVPGLFSAPAPAPISGPMTTTLDDYEVIVCDKYGLAAGQINTAVPTQISDELNGMGQATIDFWILDPSASVLPPTAIPGGVEIQIWQAGVLIWWGVPVSCTFDAAAVHLQCQGLLWYYSTRNFGPNPFNYLGNPGFELGTFAPSWAVFPAPGDTMTAEIIQASSFGTDFVLEGLYAALLSSTLVSADSFISQQIPFESGPNGDTYELAAWAWWPGLSPPIPDPLPVRALAFEQRGLFASCLVGNVGQAYSPQVQQVDANTPGNQWSRLSVQVLAPPSASGVIDCRLYSEPGYIIWDAARLTKLLAVGMSADLSPLTTDASIDAADIIRNICNYASDPAWGKTDIAMPTVGGPTGVLLQRLYQLSDNGGVLDAINEFPSIGVCDFAVRWDQFGHFRWLQLYAPARGVVQYNFPLELDIGETADLQGAIDGSQVGTSQRVLGQGSSGASADIGYSSFPSFLGGRVGRELATFTIGSTNVTTEADFFLPTDVGLPIYSLIQALPLGAVITAYNDPRSVDFAAPHSADPNAGATRDVVGDTVGVGGTTIDSVQSAIQDQPISTLAGTAQQALIKGMEAQIIPAAKVRRDAEGSIFASVDVGDIIPVRINYGWLQMPGGQKLRIVGRTLYPATNEVVATLNVVSVL